MSQVVLSRNNFYHNLELISNHAGSKEKVAIVLKDNAYGHGLIEIATMAKDFGIKKAVVRTLDEALKVEKLFDYILILSQRDIHTYSHTFHITLNSLEDMDYLPHGSNVHIKVDTGMHRNGIKPEELEEAFHGLLVKNIKITGVFTHHRSADNLSSDFYWQNAIFRRVKENVKTLCEKFSQGIPSFHSCNSSALFRHNNFNEDFARVGIASYGYIETDSSYNLPDLKPVLSLWGDKISSRVLNKGERVGYGGTYTTDKKITVSTYDIGYGDGFLRLNENQDYFTPKGYKVLGRVSMDSLSLASNENRVCIFEDAKPLAKIQNTISYEIVTTLSPNIERKIE